MDFQKMSNETESATSVQTQPSMEQKFDMFLKTFNDTFNKKVEEVIESRQAAKSQNKTLSQQLMELSAEKEKLVSELKEAKESIEKKVSKRYSFKDKLKSSGAFDADAVLKLFPDLEEKDDLDEDTLKEVISKSPYLFNMKTETPNKPIDAKPIMAGKSLSNNSGNHGLTDEEVKRLGLSEQTLKVLAARNNGSK